MDKPGVSSALRMNQEHFTQVVELKPPMTGVEIAAGVRSLIDGAMCIDLGTPNLGLLKWVNGNSRQEILVEDTHARAIQPDKTYSAIQVVSGAFLAKRHELPNKDRTMSAVSAIASLLGKKLNKK